MGIISRIRPETSYIDEIVKNENLIRVRLNELSNTLKTLPPFGARRFHTDSDIKRLSACLEFAGLKGKP
jgi:hypothetical protein